MEMKFFEILKENKKDNFVDKYSKVFSKEEIERIVESVKPKYLDWVGKVLNRMNFDENLNNLISTLNDFELFSTNLKKTDINQYDTLNELFEEIQNYKNKTRRDFKLIEGNVIVFEDENFLVVNPQTLEGSCYYGSGTKWCTTQRTTFENYNDDSKLFYFLDKKKKSSDPFYKVALLYNFDGRTTFYNSKDSQIKDGWIFGSSEFEEIMESIKDYMKTNYKEQLLIWSDQEKKEKEYKRINSLRISREIRNEKLDANERRVNAEWNLDDDCPEEGLLAHALFEYLVKNGTLEPLTNEDILKINRIKEEIDNINNKNENSKELNTDLLDKIEELENELEVLNEKVDVYILAPTNDFYYMKQFKILKEDSYDLEWSVGDEQMTYRSAKEYVNDLINDVGITSFNKSFYSNYLSEDLVKDHMRDYYSTDVYENPEIYFDDSQRQLSDDQVEEIQILKRKIEQDRRSISQLENIINNSQSEREISDLENSIEEIQQKISDSSDEISEIEDNPSGEFPSELFDSKIDELVENNDPESWIEDTGSSYEDYIDIESMVEGVIESDGYGMLSSWDGIVNEVFVKSKIYYIVRNN